MKLVEYVISCGNIWGLLALVMCCITLVLLKNQSIKRDKQILDFIANNCPDDIHVVISEDDVLYKIDKGMNYTKEDC